MPRLYSAPRSSNPDRRVFDNARTHGNEILAHTIQLDQFAQRLQRQGEREPALPDFSELIDQAKERTQKVLATHEFDATATWTDFYRLLGYQELLDEIIYAPLVFNHPNRQRHKAECKQLVNGVFGINATIIESALEQYDHPYATPEEREHLKGVINEHTAAALLNMEQRSDSITLPTSPGADIRAKTDLVRHSVQTGAYEALPIQVKSHPPGDRRNMTPEGGILVTANEMGNSERSNFMTARAIVAEVTGATDLPDEERTRYAEHLRLFHLHFNKSVNNKAHLVRKKRKTIQHMSNRALRAA